MSKIVFVDKKQLAELKMNFLSCPSLAIPALKETYYSKFHWFTSLETLKETLSKITPLIVLSVSDKAPTPDKIPAHLKSAETVYCIRAWDQIPERDWIIIRNNICESDNHNFTFKWDMDHFEDAAMTIAKNRQEMAEQRAKEYDKKELEEFMTSHKSGGKRHPLLNT